MGAAPNGRSRTPDGDRSAWLSVAIAVDLNESFFREIAGGAAQYAREVGDWELYVGEHATELTQNLTNWNGHGIIARIGDDRTASALVEARVPVVAVGCTGCVPRLMPHVGTDENQIARIAFDHLRERGFTNFAYYGRKPAPAAHWSQARGDAFEACVIRAGLGFHRFTASHEPREWKAVRSELARWLQALPKPVGILSCADFHGRNLLEACRTVGLRVPHDIAVIGVDNDELDCEIAIPSLTSIAQSPRRIGHEAARLLDRAIRPDRFGSRGHAVVVPARTVIPPLGVVPRRSTDTFAAVDPAISRVIVALRDRVDAGLSLDDLAAIAELSTWQLRRRFQSVIGHSIRDHMILTRVAEAERLISTTDLPLKVVARRSGFSSVTYMTTMFRRRYGDPPARYRRLGQRTRNSEVTKAAAKTERRCRES